MAYPADWLDPKHDWLTTDPTSQAQIVTGFNRIERNIDLLGDRLFDHIGLAGEWYSLTNPEYYLAASGWDSSDNILDTTGMFDNVYYMQIDKTIWLRGQILLSSATDLYTLVLAPRHPPVLDHDFTGMIQLCGEVSWELGAARAYGNAITKTINTHNCICLQSMAPIAVDSLDCFFAVSYEQKSQFAPAYLATTTSTTTAAP
jgi:hypothetical protein